MTSLSGPLFIDLYGHAVSTARFCHLRHSDLQQTMLKPSLQIFKIHRLRKSKRALEASYGPLGEAVVDLESCWLFTGLVDLEFCWLFTGLVVVPNFALFRFDGLSWLCFGSLASLYFSNGAITHQTSWP